MSSCDMCGSETELIHAVVEGVMLNVCENCARHGKVVKIAEKKPEPKIQFKSIEEEEVVVEDCASKIKEARERLNLKQEDLALNLAEKASLIHKIESNQLSPSIELAKKIQDFLNIKLVTKYKEPVKLKKLNFKDEKLTIGDLINIKKAKSK